MTDNSMCLLCIVNGDATPFSVDIDESKTVDHLKKAIKLQKAVAFADVDADMLTLWRVSIPLAPLNERRPIVLSEIKSAAELDPTDDLSDVFAGELPRKTIHIIVQRPLQVLKRDREGDEGEWFAFSLRPDVLATSIFKHFDRYSVIWTSSKRVRLGTSALRDAIEATGLTEKAMVNDRTDIDRLDNNERVSVLKNMGQEIDNKNIFISLSSTAAELQGASIKVMDKLSAPRDSLLPVIDTNDLYVRQAFGDLYDTILGNFENNRPYDPEHQKQVVVSGTSGIGKSAFLIYFAIRLIGESNSNNPPIIIFHTKRSEKCYAFGGYHTVRSGYLEDFEPFLDLDETWYLVDSSPNPVLSRAKTIISASPKTLAPETQQNKDVDKRVAWHYYMAPWDLEELKICRCKVAGFQVVPEGVVEKLYSKIGGVPRYVLERPMRSYL
ncbi:hypothetical protein BGZ92_005192 [Podila epicladia]|nr:hypothetical protein BGZ92_005192 [Podila epicladia]